MNRNEENSTENAARGDYLVKRSKKTDFIAKIVCFVGAFLLWLYVMQVDSPEYQQPFLPVLVEISGTDVIANQHNLSVYSGIGHSVEVIVRGKKSDISKLTSADIAAYVDVSQIAEAGEYQLDVRVSLPTSLTLESVSPTSLTVYVDELASKTLQIYPKIANLVVESPNQAGDPVIENDDITVTGPKRLIDALAYAQVNLDVGKTDVTVNLISDEIVLIKTNGDVQAVNANLKLSRTEVAVRIPIYTYKTIPLSVAFRYGYFNDANVDVILTPESVRVKGDPGVLMLYDTITVATLDEKKIADNEVQQTILTLPDGLESADGIDTVSIDIRHKNTVTREFRFSKNRISVINPSGLPYEILDDYVALRFRGSEEEIEAMKNADISVTLDLSGYSAETSGIVSEMLTIKLDDTVGSTVYETGDYRVQVSINS